MKSNLKKMFILLLTLIFSSCTAIQVQDFVGFQQDSIAIVRDNNVSDFVVNDLDYNIRTDAFNRLVYVDVDGKVENHRNYPVKLLITLPLKDKNKKIIHTFKIEKYLKAKEIYEISKRFTAPHFVYGYLNKEDIKIQVLTDGNDSNINIIFDNRESRKIENLDIHQKVDGVKTTTTTHFNNGTETKTKYEINSSTTRKSSYIGY